jgi:hypothetical protein
LQPFGQPSWGDVLDSLRTQKVSGDDESSAHCFIQPPRDRFNLR